MPVALRFIRLPVLLCALLASLLVAADAHASQPGFLRVDQIGYGTWAPKRAYLLTTSADPGARFEVRRVNGAVAFHGVIGRSLGGWNRRLRYVYPLDFDQVRGPGLYLIVVSGRVSAASPRFRVSPSSELFGSAVRNALRFYQTERDGPDFIRSPLRSAPGHLNDEHALTYLPPATNSDGIFRGELTPLGGRIDASGGWWDAGDYLKFVQTTSYTVDLMLAGIRDFPARMGPGGSADFTAEARFGLSWLLRMWDDPTRTLYFQVGIGEGNAVTAGDHDIWRLPQADDTFGGRDPQYRYIRHRPVFRAGPPGSPVSPNLAGRLAAAFGLCAQVFHASDPALARRCLLAGEHVFDLADTDPRRLLTVIPYSFYPETEWRDDLELGATELAKALAAGGGAGSLPGGLPHDDELYYLKAATRWARAYMEQGDADSDPLNLYDVSGLADYDLHDALVRAGSPAGLAVTAGALVADIRRQLQDAQLQTRADPFGFGFPWNASDTTSHGAGLSVLASEYASLTGDARYRALSVRWLDSILGANAWGASLIIGDGSNFPRCPQHQVANIAGSLTGSGSVLAGAVVEGPTSTATSGALDGMRACPGRGGDRFSTFDGRAVFEDNVQSYSTVEPAIDLTATSPMAFAWQMRPGG